MVLKLRFHIPFHMLQCRSVEDGYIFHFLGLTFCLLNQVLLPRSVFDEGFRPWMVQRSWDGGITLRAHFIAISRGRCDLIEDWSGFAEQLLTDISSQDILWAQNMCTIAIFGTQYLFNDTYAESPQKQWTNGTFHQQSGSQAPEAVSCVCANTCVLFLCLIMYV